MLIEPCLIIAGCLSGADKLLIEPRLIIAGCLSDGDSLLTACAAQNPCSPDVLAAQFSHFDWQFVCPGHMWENH